MNLLLKKELELLKTLLSLLETQKELIKSSRKDKIDHFLKEKGALLKELYRVDSDIKISTRDHPHLINQSQDIVDEIKWTINQILLREEEDRNNINYEIIMTKSLLEKIKKGKQSLRVYGSQRKKNPRFINTRR
jgi:hypothetical protein